MRILAALTFVLAACGSSTQQAPATTTQTDVAAESCCCKSTPLTSPDGQAVFEAGNRMECSAKQGECVPDVQCETQAEPAE